MIIFQGHAYEDIGFSETGRWGNQGSGMLFTTGEKILLLERSGDVEEPYTWGLPGGAIPQEGDDFKDVLESARDEVEEELGTVPRHTVIDQYVYQEPNFRYVTFIARVDPAAEQLDFELNWENDSWLWATQDELDQLDLHFGVMDLLRHKDPFQ